MKHFSLLLALLISPQLQASEWDELDLALSQPLCVAFENDATYRFERRNCTRWGCDRYFYFVRTFCGETATGLKRATIQQFTTPGGSMSQESISEQDWNNLRGNLLRFRARYADSFGLRFELVNVVREGDNLKASYQIWSAQGQITEQGHWIFGKGPAAIPQVLERFASKQGFLNEEDLQTLVP